MARIYPTRFPEPPGQPSREDRYFHRLRKELSDDWTIYYSLKLQAPNVEHREIDFVAIGPTGVLAIELKNGLWRLESGTWYQKIRGDWTQPEPKAYNGPIEQTTTACAALRSFFTNHNRLQETAPAATFVPLLILLKNAADSLTLPNGEEKYVVFRDEARAPLDETFDRVTSRQKSPPLTKKQIRLHRDIIELNTNFVRTFAQKRAGQEAELLALTREQFRPVAQMDAGARILLWGVAGSGKSLVAIQAARRASRAGKRVLLVCHSSNLSAHFERRLSDAQNITIATMANLCKKIVQSYEPEYGKRNDEPKRTGDFAEVNYTKAVLPAKTLDYTEAYARDNGQFDVVILDEAQDILTETEILVFNELLKGELSQGTWLVCYDPRQALKGEIESGLNHLRDQSPILHELKKNIRTPTRVFEAASKLADLKGRAALGDVTGVQWVQYDADHPPREKLIETISYAIRLGYRPEDIVVLSPIIQSRTTGIGSARKFGDHTLQAIKDGQRKEGVVGFALIDRFKGLETPYVILMGIDDFADPEMHNPIYVALTRCTGAAAVLFHESQREYLEEVLGS